MPVIQAPLLDSIVDHVLQAAGAPEDFARTVAEHLVDSNLAGHDSHGVQRLPQYIQAIDDGLLMPANEPVIVDETPAVVQIDGKWTFGQVIAKYGTELAIAKARSTGVGFVTMYHEGHTGRLGTYPEMATRAGMACALWDGVIGGYKANQVPFGGSERKLGANPIALGFPGAEQGPIILDYATSMSAAGKVAVARASGKSLPGEWIVDGDGNPSINPDDYYTGGALRPMGLPGVGHKGYAMAFMVGLFGLLASMRSDVEWPGGNRWGTALLVIDIARFGPVDQFRKQVDQAIGFVKAGEAQADVRYPGEFERHNREHRRANGIELPESTWDEIRDCIRRFDLEAQLAPLP